MKEESGPQLILTHSGCPEQLSAYFLSGRPGSISLLDIPTFLFFLCSHCEKSAGCLNVSKTNVNSDRFQMNSDGSFLQ